VIFNRFYIQLAIPFLLLGTYVSGQEAIRYNQQMMTYVAGDSILLRWAPLNYETWKQGMKHGYTLERITLYAKGGILPANNRTNKVIGPIIPYSEKQWSNLMDRDNYAGIAAEAMYGESFELNAGEGNDVLRMFDVATEQQNRYSFALFAADMSADAARASALYYADKDVKTGEKYLYRVFVNANDTIPKDTSYVFTGPDEKIPLSIPVIEDVAADDKMAMISWQIPPSRGEYTAYFIERSEDNGITYKTINPLPLTNFSEQGKKTELGYYIDTLPQNEAKYVYRVKGVSPFGITGPYSDTVSTRGTDRVRAIPQITQHNMDGEAVHLVWEFPENELKKIKGFKVLRGLSDKELNQDISGLLDQNTTTFTDRTPLPTAYYKIAVLDKQNRTLSSLAVMVQLADTIPPAPPQGLKALVDTSGNVTLTWQANREADIYGYRVYRANSQQEEFSQLTVAPVRDTVFIDKVSLKTLTQSVYYKILANDIRQNYSGFSEILEVRRPDIIPPSSPMIQGIQATNTGIYIHWVNSASADVRHNVLIRKADDSLRWVPVQVLSATDTSYCDFSAKQGTLYAYNVLAVDSAGNTSPNINPASARRKLTGCLAITELRYTILRDKDAIRLNWENPGCAERYIIYRGCADKPMETYRNTIENVFLDDKLIPDTKYLYAVKAISETDVSGSLKTIEVIY